MDDISSYLNEKKAQLEARIDAIEGDYKSGRSADFAEQAVENENNQVLDSIEHEAKAELEQVNQALARLKNGLYGDCTWCDKPIAPERLQALPYTTVCINCAE